MITENGIVIQTTDATAWIKTNRTAACESCASRDSCGGGHHPSQEMTVEVENTLGVAKGDHVVIGIETKPVMLLTFLVYVVPIICLVAGALAGDILAHSYDLDPSFTAMASGFSLFGIAFLIIRIKSSRLNAKEGYRPFLVRKRNALVSASCPPRSK